ncbi:spore germination protein [Paenibacillus sp. YYML68]|uniref:spore germination protein n=1 Tax=Paenibacillus sp. YYML68 TaxID=2909250 RepID=UPI0024920B9F|nr:spore germination protein [Paenibacillus sp. YYML68]
MGTELGRSLSVNLQHIRSRLGASSDIVIREFEQGGYFGGALAVLYTDGLVDTQLVHDHILQALMLSARPGLSPAEPSGTPAERYLAIRQRLLHIGDLKELTTFAELYKAVLSGNTVILTDGIEKALVAGTPGWRDRGVTETTVENVIRGPKESFTETLRTNTALIRRRIRDERLRCEEQSIGKVTMTDVAVMYIEGIAQPSIVEEVRRRLSRIEADSILESGYIEEYIQDKTYTVFPTMFNSERPDVIAAGLLEGRIAILVDGTPVVLLAPSLFGEFFQSAEDYYQRSDISSLLRVLRYLCFFISLLAPSLYIAITTFHQEMLPTQLLISLASQREGIPFPAFVEALMMELAFEILREAGIRMPRSIGQAISVVGALVIGQAAVEAGIISAAMVIVVSMTAISNFVFPSFSMAISVRILRFSMMTLAATFGLFGITIGLLALVIHLCSLRSFGVPYMTPFAPFNSEGQKDMVIRLPHWLLNQRPTSISPSNPHRDQTPPPKPNA